MEAVKQNGDALAYVKEQDEEICKSAVEQSKHSLVYVEDKFLYLFEDFEVDTVNKGVYTVEVYCDNQTNKNAVYISKNDGSTGAKYPIENTKDIGDMLNHYIETYYNKE